MSSLILNFIVLYNICDLLYPGSYPGIDVCLKPATLREKKWLLAGVRFFLLKGMYSLSEETTLKRRIQLTSVSSTSTSLIANNRLSRSENPVVT